MQATINTMFVNEKIIRIYLFCPFSTWNTRQMHFKRIIATKSSHPPPWPLKIWEGWGGGTNCKTKSSNILDPEDRSTCICEDGTIIPPRTEGGGKKDNKRDN